MKKPSTRALTFNVFAVACVAFSTHCGAGFAAGTQEVIYYVGKGFYGPLMPIIAMLILTPLQYVVAETARSHNVFDYKSVTSLIYRPFPKLGSILFEIGFIMMVVSATAAVVSGGGTIVNQVFGLASDHIVGSIVVALTITLVSIFGVKAVNACGTFMAVGIIAIIAIVTCIGIPFAKDTIAYQWENQITYADFGNALWWACLYAGMQCMTQTTAISSVVENFQNKKQSIAFAILATIINIAMLVAVCFMLQGFMPEVLTDPEASVLPTLYAVEAIAEAKGMDWLGILYPIMYLFAAITTGVGIVFSLAKRLEPITLKKISPEKKNVKYGILAAIIMVACWIFAQVGIVNIVKYAYQYISFYCVFAIIIPVVILGLRNLHKEKKAAKLEGHEEA